MAGTERVRDWAEKTSASMLLAAAVLGLAYEGAHILFGSSEFVKGLPSGEGPLIFLVSMLCGGLGLERLLILHKVRATIEAARAEQLVLSADAKSMSNAVAEIKASLRQAAENVRIIFDTVGKIETEVVQVVEMNERYIIQRVDEMNKTKSLIGMAAIEEAATKIIVASKNSDDIIATSQASETDLLSVDYFKTMAERVKRAKSENGEMEVHVVVAAGARGTDKRSDIFEENKIGDRLFTRRAKQPWPFEVLIVGNSMIIALRGGREKPNYEVAINIEDSEFVSKASKWFREAVWEDAARDTQSDDPEKPPAP